MTIEFSIQLFFGITIGDHTHLIFATAVFGQGCLTWTYYSRYVAYHCAFFLKYFNIISTQWVESPIQVLYSPLILIFLERKFCPGCPTTPIFTKSKFLIFSTVIHCPRNEHVMFHGTSVPYIWICFCFVFWFFIYIFALIHLWFFEHIYVFLFFRETR